MDDIDRTRRERELYLRLLELGEARELEGTLAEALRLAVEATGAEQGYMELSTEGDAKPRWAIARSGTEQDVAAIRSRISQGIVQKAIATGETIHLPSALLDPEIGQRLSIQQKRIEAVLCVPLGESPCGVLYLQGRQGAGEFQAPDVALAETMARQVAPILTRIGREERSRAELDPTEPWRKRLAVREIIGRSPAIAEVLEQVWAFAPYDTMVLITGPSGTGKTSIARAIHENSPRRGRPFVVVPAGVLTPNLAENELFGAEPGGHSAALHSVQGKVAAAEGGTLFFDDVSELPYETQGKLLTLLQDKIYSPLGSASRRIANVRFIAATNADLEALVKAKQFREDLYFRLNVAPIRMPALAERREDLVPLAEYFLEQKRVELSGGSGAAKLPRCTLSPGARYELERAEWPGNVREVENAIHRALLHAHREGVTQITARHLFPEQARVVPKGSERLTFQEATRRFQAKLVLDTLEATSWNVSESARRLDITRGYMHTLIKQFGLTRDGGTAAYA